MKSAFQRIADKASKEYGSATAAGNNTDTTVGNEEIRADEIVKSDAGSTGRDELADNR